MKVIIALVSGIVGGATAGLVVGTMFLGGDGGALDETRYDASHEEHGDAATDPEDKASVAPRRSFAKSDAPADAADLSSLLGDLRIDPVVEGDGSISGRVHDLEGNGVAGVLIRATSRSPSTPDPDRWRTGDGVPPELSLDERVRTYLKAQKRLQALRREATTDADGRYTLSGLNEDGYSITGYLRGFEIKPRKGLRVFDCKAGQVVDLEAHPVIALQVHVNLPDGGQPSEARLLWVADNERRTQRWRPNDIEIRKSPGTYEIEATAGDDEEFVAESQTVTISAGDVPEPLVFNLRSRIGIVGELRFEGAEGVQNIRIYCLRIDGAVPSDEDLMSKGKDEWVNEWNNFSFKFMDLAPGRYLVGAGSRGKKLIAKTTANVADSIERIVLEVVPLDAKEYLSVRVTASEGTALGSLNFETGIEVGNFPRSTSTSAIKKGAGHYWVMHYDDENLDGAQAVGRRFVRVSSKMLGKKTVYYDGVDAREVGVHFQASGSVDVTVQGYAGRGLEGLLHVRIDPKEAGKSPNAMRSFGFGGQRKDSLDSQGKIVIEPVQPGEAELILDIRGSSRFELKELERVPIVVQPGKNSVAVTVPPLYSLAVTVDDDMIGKTLSIRKNDGRMDFGRTREKIGDSKRVKFERLLAGEYIISRGFASGGSMTVSLPGPASVHFQPQKNRALRVTINDEKGALAKAGLKTGDLVVGVNGREFTDEMQMQLALATVLGRSGAAESTLMIQRNGKFIELEIDLASTGGDVSSMGGFMLPSPR